MTKTRVKWLLLILIILTSAALLIPGSPFYLTKVRKPAQKEYEGHSKSYWIENLNNPDPSIRLDAIRAMGQYGPEASETVPALTKFMLEDSDRLVRNEAALALSKMHAPSAVPAFAQALEDKEPIVRLNACLALSRLRKEARPALTALIKALRDKDNDTNAKTFQHTIHEIAALAIGRATAGTADGVPILLESLSYPRSPDMRRAVARALGEIGPEARSAVPQLRLLQKDTVPFVREAATEAIEAIGVDKQHEVSDTDTGNIPGK